MMDEKKVIDRAYEDALCNLFKVFLESYTSAQGNASEEQKAENRFCNGLKHLRRVHSRAIELLA